MKQFLNRAIKLCTAITPLVISMNAWSQVKPILTSQVQTTKLKLATSSFNKSISPEYLNAAKKLIKTTAKTALTTNTSSTARSTVTLNRGGTEGATPQTQTSAPAQTGNYTCVTRNVNERTDYLVQPVFSPQANFIYPGALLNAASIINNQFAYYIPPTRYQRKPYRISANLFTMTGAPQNPTEIIGDNEDYSLASFRAAQSLILNRNASANPPVDPFVEYIEATTREEVAVKLGYNFSASIPPELTALLTSIPVGVNQNVSADVLANQVNDKSRIILKINYNFYSVDASPTNDDYTQFLSPAAGSDIPTSVVYVSSVLYGSTGYVYFESDKSTSELQTVLEETIGASGPLNEGSASVNVSADARAKFSSTVTKMIAYGRGLGVSPESSLQLTSLDNLLALIGTLRSWGPNNQGAPIAYTMNFLNDGVQAVVGYSTQFPNKVCTQTPLTDLKFDVDLELERFDVANVKDLDGTEDLYGQIDFKNLKANSKTVSADVNLFSKAESNANNNNYKNGSAPIDKRVRLVSNLSFDELRNLELTVGGRLADDEGILGSRIFKCQECSSFSGDYGSRTIKFIELNNTQSSLNSLNNNGDFQLLKFGGDNFFELNFYESNNKNDGWVKALFKVWVKPHN